MTDSLDLDEMDIGEDEEESKEGAYGDWLWRGEGDPEDEPEPRWTRPTADGDDEDGPNATAAANGTTGADDGVTETTANDESAPGDQPAPKVPGGPKGPVGVPKSKGGSGGGSAASASQESAGSQRSTDHGGDAEPSDMTLAFTYEAINRLTDPHYAVADARGWADWIGIVGDVSTPVIRKFQRDAAIDLDFFGGSENGPAQRLADVTEESMFYAERMVLVGVDDEEIAEAADWEFVPLETAAEKADWEIEFET